MDKIKLKVIEKVKSELLKAQDDIYLCGTFGSLSEDIDVLIILRENDKDAVNFKHYSNILNQVKKTQQALLKDKIQTVIFPTFRLQVWAEEKARYKGKNQRTVSLHLLVYPSLKAFLEWEKSLLAYAILKSFNSFWHHELKPEALKKNTRLESLPKRLNPYISLFYETFRLMECGTLDNRLIRKEAFHKLKYIIKFVIFEAYYTKDYSKRNYEFPNSIVKKAASHTSQGAKLFRFINRYSMKKLPSKQLLKRMFAETAVLLNRLRQNKNSETE